MPTLALVNCLLLEGWSPAEHPPPLQCGCSHQFRFANLQRSSAYFEALLEIDTIWAKDGRPEFIYHHLPQSYYVYLMQLEKLWPLSGLSKSALEALFVGIRLGLFGSVSGACCPHRRLAQLSSYDTCRITSTCVAPLPPEHHLTVTFAS